MEASVIIPVYNVKEEYLRKCFDSVTAQTVKDIEIIVVDDGSTDNSSKICDEYARRDDRIKVFHQENQGVSVCRNIGIKNAQGRWLAFVDSDDWLESNYLESMMRIGDGKQSDIVISDCFVNYKKKQEIVNFYKEEYLDTNTTNRDRFILQFLCSKIYGDCSNATDSGAPWCKLYRRGFIIDNTLLYRRDLRRMQDNVFNLYAFQKAENIVYIQKPLYHYRKSESSGFNKFNPDISKYYTLVFDTLVLFINEFKKSDAFKDALNYKILCSIYPIIKMDIFCKTNPATYKEKRNKLVSILESPYYKTALMNVKTQYLSSLEKILLFLAKRKYSFLIMMSLYAKNAIYKLTGRGV